MTRTTSPSVRRRVLLVDDDPVTRRILGAALHTAGYVVDEAATVLQAMQFASASPPLIGILDMRLPDGTGLELARALRRLAGCEELPMVAITGVESTFVGLEVIADLFIARMVKPVVPHQLLDLVGRNAKAKAEPRADAVSVVLVDDEPLSLRLIEVFLTRDGFAVRTAEDGLAALARIREAKPDVVVADLDMPGMTGPALAAALRDEPDFRDVPVVVMTSGVQTDAPAALAHAAGVNAIVPKTNELSRLIPAVRKALEEGAVQIDAVPGPGGAAIAQVAAQARAMNALHARLDAREEELNVVAGIADSVRRHTSVDGLLGGTVERLCDLAYCAFAAAWRPDDRGDLALAATAWVPPDQQERFRMLPSRHPVLRSSLELGHMMVIPDAGLPTNHGQGLLQALGAKTVLVIPLVHRDEPLGLVLLGGYSEELRTNAWALGQTVQAQLEQALSLMASLRVQEATAQSFRSIAESLSEAVFTVQDGLVVYANSVARLLCGRSADLDGEPLGDWLLKADGSEPDEGIWNGRLRHEGGRDRHVDVRTSRLPAGSPLGTVVYTVRDVTRQKEHQRWMQRLANEDPLTGLPNRRAFESVLAELEQPHERRRRYRRLGVVFFDLDGFKAVNDNHGHDAGDALLRAIAGAVRGRLRAAEIVARVGGDEFVVLLLDADQDDVRRVGELIRELVVTVAAEHPEEVTASVGVALGERAEPPLDVVRAADAAMYEAKRAGGNRVRRGAGA